MATVKEVQLMDGEDQVTPVTLINSVKNPDGSMYKDSVYTKSEVDSKFKSYTITGDVGSVDKNGVTVSLKVGESASIFYDVSMYGAFQIKATYNGWYFIIPYNGSANIKECLHGLLYDFENYGSGSTYRGVMYIVRLA